MTNELLLSKKRVKAFLNGLRLRVSDDFYDAINEEIKLLLLRVAKRAKSNGRSTALSHDV